MRILPLINIAVISLWLAACSFDTDDASPTVIETMPEDGAEGVVVDTDITVTFSEALLGETLNTESMTVTLDGEIVPGTLSYDDTSNSLVFTPESLLIKTLEYTVTLDPEITDLARNRLGDHSFSFTVRDGEWGEAAMLSDGAGNASNPVIAFAPDGTAIAAWLQNDGAYNVVNAAHYAPDFGGWGFPGPIDIYELGDAVSPQIGTGANGDTFVVWGEDDDGTANGGDGSGNNSIWAIRYTVEGGWEAPQLLEDSNSTEDHAAGARIAVDGEGNAIAVWLQQNDLEGGRWDAWYNIFSAESLTWQGAELLETDDAGDAGSPQIAMNADGQAAAVWSQPDAGGINSVYANRYSPGDGWQGVEEIDSDPDNLTHGAGARVAVNAGGDVAVTWTQADDFSTLAGADYQSRFFDGEWSDPLPVSDADRRSLGTNITLDNQGRAMATWADIDDTNNYFSLMAAVYDPGDGWSDPAFIQENPERSILSSSLAIDPFGNALVVWSLIDGGFSDIGSGVDVSVYASRYLGSSGEWSEPEPIETSDTLALVGGLTITPPGDGLAVWQQADESGTRVIYTNLFQ